MDQLTSLSQEIEKSESRNNKQSKIEEVLKKQVAELQFKLGMVSYKLSITTIFGHKHHKHFKHKFSRSILHEKKTVTEF